MILLSILVKVTSTTTLTLIGVRFAAKSRAAVRRESSEAKHQPRVRGRGRRDLRQR
jgi:hypothetical protein